MCARERNIDVASMERAAKLRHKRVSTTERSWYGKSNGGEAAVVKVVKCSLKLDRKIKIGTQALFSPASLCLRFGVMHRDCFSSTDQR